MAKRRKLLLRRPKHTKTVNQVPGTMTYVGHKESSETKLEVIDYNADQYERYTSNSPDDAFNYVDEKSLIKNKIDASANKVINLKNKIHEQQLQI